MDHTLHGAPMLGGAAQEAITGVDVIPFGEHLVLCRAVLHTRYLPKPAQPQSMVSFDARGRQALPFPAQTASRRQLRSRW